jgi:hypothetical protein
VAARFLPPNTLLVTGDLLQPGFTGRYVVAKGGVEKDHRLSAQDVADQPDPPDAPPVRLLLSLPVPFVDVISRVNAGMVVQLCGKPPNAFGPVKVEVVRCNQDEVPSCSATVEVSSDAAAGLANKGLKDKASSAELHLAATCG